MRPPPVRTSIHVSSEITWAIMQPASNVECGSLPPATWAAWRGGARTSPAHPSDRAFEPRVAYPQQQRGPSGGVGAGLSETQKQRALNGVLCNGAGGGGLGVASGADRPLGGEPHRVAGDDLARHVTETGSEVRAALEPDEAVLRDVDAVLAENCWTKRLRTERRDQDLQAVHLHAQSHASGLDLR